MQQYGINVAEMVVLLLKQTSLWSRITHDFKTGQFVIPAGGIEHADRIGSQLMGLKKYFYGMESPKNKRFKRSMVCSYIIADKHPGFDYKRFRTACKSKSSWFLTGTSTADYVAIIERIYNAGLTAKNKINLVEFHKTKEYLES